jgi:y4mF family transcriptional regulator
MEIVSMSLLGEAIRYHRRRSGLSQRSLADLAQIGKTSVFDLEKGKSTVRMATLMAVLRVLNIRVTLASPLMGEFAEHHAQSTIEEQR